MDRFLCVLLCFCKYFAPDEDFTEQLQMFWPHFESRFVPSSSSLRKCILTEHFFLISWSLIPVLFFLFLSLYVFQLLTNHFLLSESNVCVVAQWCDLLVKAKTDSKTFTAFLDQNQLVWVRRMDVMCEVSEMLSAHLTFTPNSVTVSLCQEH